MLVEPGGDVGPRRPHAIEAGEFRRCWLGLRDQATRHRRGLHRHRVAAKNGLDGVTERR
jgi:hypothetical protein